jgi:long-chain fatty acid transport protein
MRRGAHAGAAVLCACAVASPAAASPEDIFGYGARTSAMGATGAAHARGYEVAFANPALASLARENSRVLGMVAANPRLSAAGAGLPGRVSVDAVRSVLIGLEVPLPLGGPLTRRVGLALGFATPLDVIVRGRVLYPERTQFPVLADRGQSLTLRAGLGVDVGHGLRLGLGVAALAELTGKVVAATDVSGRVGTSVESQLVATYAPAFGATWETRLGTRRRDRARLRVGVVARGELDARFSVVVDGTKLSSLPIPRFDIAGMAQYDPKQIAVEVAREDDLHTFALQVAGKRWSAFPGIVQPTIVCSDGDRSCGIAPPRIGWRDTFAVRAGVERRLSFAPGATFAARAGASFETSPLPAELPTSEAYARAVSGVVQVPTAYFDASRVVSSLGVGVALARPLPPVSIDVFVQCHTLLPRTIRSVDPSGDVRLEGEASGMLGVFGAAAAVRF